MKRLFLKIVHAFIYFFFIALFFILFPISNLIYIQKKIWIICERGYDARDNGYHFFKYLVNNHPEVKCFYAIHKKSSDYKNVSQFNNVLEFGSFKHIFFFTCARAKISSQMFGYAPNKYYLKFMQKHHLQGKNIGLKHGIFKNIHPNYFKENSHLDLIICGAKPEFEFVKTNFGYKESEVAYCGLARFDNLYNCEIKNQILIMPTFRIPLSCLSDEEFVTTDYFKKWNELLRELDKHPLLQNDYKVVFYLHAVFQKYIHLFKDVYKNILIASFDKYDIQTLLKESKVLITDFSSVFFDFSYMRKPTIFYQFDEDFYNENHYQKGYFDYRLDGFGKVSTNEQQCIDELDNILRNDCKIDDTFGKKIDLFFTLPNDQKNCERIYKEISKIL